MSRTSMSGRTYLLVVAFAMVATVAVGCARKEFVAGPWIQVWPPPEQETASGNPRSGPSSNVSQVSRAGEEGAQTSVPPPQAKPNAKSGDGLDGQSPSEDGASLPLPESVDVAKDQRLSDTQKQVLTQQITAIRNNLRDAENGSSDGASGQPFRGEADQGQLTEGRPTDGKERSQVADRSSGSSPLEQPPSNVAALSAETSQRREKKTDEPRSHGAGSLTASPASQNSSTDLHYSQPAPSAEQPPSGPSSGGPAFRTQSGRWRGELQQAIESLRRELEESDSISEAERGRLEAALRLLYVVGEQRDDSVREIQALEGEGREFWKLTAAGLYELLDPNGSPVPDRRNKLALRFLREAVHHLAAASSLDVRNLAICKRVESFGQYLEFDPYEFKAEQEVILYVEVANFAVEQKAEGYETEFQGSYQILDTSGRRIADYDLPLDKQTCRNLRTDYFLPYRIFLPKSLPAGSYQIQVTIEDKKGKKFGQSPPVMFSIRS